MKAKFCARCKNEKIALIFDARGFRLECLNCGFQWQANQEDIFFALKYDNSQIYI